MLEYLFDGEEIFEFPLLTSTSILVRGQVDGQTVTIDVAGTGFSQGAQGEPNETGTITSFNYYVGATIDAAQLIGTIDLTVSVAEISSLADEDDSTDSAALETFFSSQDWVFNGTRFVDNLPESYISVDGVTINLVGNDLFNLDAGNDLLFAGDGNDTVNGGIGFDAINGGAGDDVIDGGLQADLIHGNDGNDSLIGGIGFDVMHGDDGDDTLDGGATPDRLFGGNGNDLIMAGSNFGFTRDGAFGGAGNDTLYGQAGYDLLEGGEGDDLLDGGNQADNLLGGQGNDTMMGGQGLDRLFGGDDDDIGYGGIGTDGMFGERGNDTLYGEDGNDRFFGGSGNDMLFGGGDRDTIYAGSGFDTVDGGAGDDLLQGNFNADVFVFSDGHGHDTISDFDATNDLERIDLRGISVITGFADLVANHLHQIGAAAVIATEDLPLGSSQYILLSNTNLADLDAADFIF